MVARQAAKRGAVVKGKFWNDPQYERDFKLQLRLAMGLLNKFSFDAILNVLRSKDGKWPTSFAVKSLLPLFEREQVRLADQQRIADAAALPPASPEPLPPPTPLPTFRKPTSNKSSLDKLEGL